MKFCQKMTNFYVGIPSKRSLKLTQGVAILSNLLNTSSAQQTTSYNQPNRISFLSHLYFHQIVFVYGYIYGHMFTYIHTFLFLSAFHPYGSPNHIEVKIPTQKY